MQTLTTDNERGQISRSPHSASITVVTRNCMGKFVTVLFYTLSLQEWKPIIKRLLIATSYVYILSLAPYACCCWLYSVCVFFHHSGWANLISLLAGKQPAVISSLWKVSSRRSISLATVAREDYEGGLNSQWR